MDWLQFLQAICIPAFAYLIYKIGHVEQDVAAFKLKVAEDAKNYATNEAILRMESKIDDLRDLIIDELKTKKANRK